VLVNLPVLIDFDFSSAYADAEPRFNPRNPNSPPLPARKLRLEIPLIVFSFNFC
jgi:hypothetical protein